jgi:alpha,alpha-trehalase
MLHAGVYPLFCRIASNRQAMEVAKNVKVNFLKSGGVLPTLNNMGNNEMRLMAGLICSG